MKLENKYLQNVMKIPSNLVIENGEQRVSASDLSVKNQGSFSLVPKLLDQEQLSKTKNEKHNLNPNEEMNSKQSSTVSHSKKTANQRYESQTQNLMERQVLKQTGNSKNEKQALYESSDQRTSKLPEFKKTNSGTIIKNGITANIDKKTPYLLKQNITVHKPGNSKQPQLVSNQYTQKQDLLIEQDKFQEDYNQLLQNQISYRDKLANQTESAIRKRSISSLSGQQQSLKAILKIDSGRKEYMPNIQPVLGSYSDSQKIISSVIDETASKKNLERGSSQTYNPRSFNRKPSNKLSAYAQTYLHSAQDSSKKVQGEQQNVVKSRFASKGEEPEPANLLPNIKLKSENESSDCSMKKRKSRRSQPSMMLCIDSLEQLEEHGSKKLTANKQSIKKDSKHQPSNLEISGRATQKKSEVNIDKKLAIPKTSSIPQLGTKKINSKVEENQNQYGNSQITSQYVNTKENSIQNSGTYNIPVLSYRRSAVESQEVVVQQSSQKQTIINKTKRNDIERKDNDNDMDQQESMDDCDEDEKIDEAPQYDPCSIERSDAKLKLSRIQNEKLRLNYNALVRERDLLRDWTKRTEQKQQIDYEQAYTAYTSTVNNKVRQSQNDSSASPFPRSNIKKASGDNFAQEAMKTITQNTIECMIPDHIVFQSNGRDTYFKKAALRKQLTEGIWRENPIPASHFFTVKWDYGDSSFDHNKVKPHQFFNHFPDTRELTTKQGLNRNLNAITAPGVDVASFYPRCFDLSDPRQLDLFISDFNRTSILNCIQKHAEYFNNILKDQDAFVQNIFTTNLKIGQSFEKCKLSMYERQKTIKKQLDSMELNLTSNNAGCINVFLLQQALFYCQNLLNETIGIDQESYHTDELFKKNCYIPVYSTSHQVQELLQNYSTFDLPIQLENIEAKGMHKLRRLRGWLPVANSSWQVRRASPLSPYLVYLTIKMSKSLEQHWPQYGSVNGTQNVWICKPCYNARGLGIFCFNQKSEIINTFSKKAPAPKVVQKYIERPLLLKNLNPRTTTDLRKFDIRQWVLVTSIEPLQVYIYKKAYLRICGSHYNIKQYDDPIRHLSNYSIQKKEAREDPCFEETEDKLMAAAGIHKIVEASRDVTHTKQQHFEFVLSTDAFISKLNTEYPELKGRGPFTWENTFYNQIKDITSKVFGRMSEVMEHKPSSFELYGLDFVIDQDLKCWLIEANMSPACAHRKGQEWLTKMTEDMADGMLNILEHKIIKSKANQKVEYNGGLNDKIAQYRAGQLQTDIKSWDKVVFEEQNAKTKTKQSQKQGFQLHHIGTNVSAVKALANQTLQRQTFSGKNAFLNIQQDNLEIHGIPANLKFERAMDRRYKKFQAAIFIQRIWRGYQVRAIFEYQAMLNLQKKLAAKSLVKILSNQMDKIQVHKEAYSPQKCVFETLKTKAWEERVLENEDNLAKLIKIQKIFRKVMAQGLDSFLTGTGVDLNMSKQSDREEVIMENDHVKIREESFASSDNELDQYGQGSVFSSPINERKKQEMNKWDSKVNKEIQLEKQRQATQSQSRLKAHQIKTTENITEKLQLRSQSYVESSQHPTELDSDSGLEMTQDGILYSSKTPTRKLNVQKTNKKSKKESRLQAFSTTITGRVFEMKTKKKSVAQKKSKERKQKERQSRSSWYSNTTRQQQFDPDLLLNYQNLGIEMIIPTSGTYFQMQGGMRIRRMNSENPIIEQDKLLQAQLQQAFVPEKAKEVAQCTVQSIKQIYQKTSPQKKQPKKIIQGSVYDVYMDAASKFMPGIKARTVQHLHQGRDGFQTQTSFTASGSKYEPQSCEKLSQRGPSKNFSNPAIMQRIQDCYQVVPGVPNNYIIKSNLDDRYSSHKKTVLECSSQKSSTKLLNTQGRSGGIWASGLTSTRKQQQMASPYLWSTAYKEQDMGSNTVPLTGQTSSLSTGQQAPETGLQMHPRNLFTTNYRSAESQSKIEGKGKGFPQRLQSREVDPHFFKKRSIIQTQKLSAGGKLDQFDSTHHSRSGAAPPLASLQTHGRKSRPIEQSRLFERVLHPKIVQNPSTSKSQNNSQGLYASRKGRRAPAETSLMMPQIQKMMKWC